MKYALSVIFIFLIRLSSYGQNENLKPSDFKENVAVLKTYFDNLFPLLYKGFADKPYARYTYIPSFSSEFAFSIEQKDDQYFIISNSLSKSYWYSKDKKRVKVRPTSTEIDEPLFKAIGELFQLLGKQIKKPEKEIMGLDGATYYFASTDYKGEIKMGETWSPDADSPMGRLVKICNNLYLIGKGKDISQSEIEKDIKRLIADLQK